MNNPPPQDTAKLGLLLADFADAWVGAERRRIETVEKALAAFRRGLEQLGQAVPAPPPPPPPADDSGPLLDRKALRQLVLYSQAHIARLEQAGKFPARIRLGDGYRSRVAWSKDEVMAWIAKRRAR